MARTIALGYPNDYDPTFDKPKELQEEDKARKRTASDMKAASKTHETIDAYIAGAPAAVRPILKKIRQIVRAAVPDAEEVISYRMPAFRYHGIVLYFAAFKNHIGVFPPVSGDKKFEKALAPYAGPKGNLKFPLDRPIPYPLIKRIALFKAKQNRSKGKRT